jgi:hypothetical protein
MYKDYGWKIFLAAVNIPQMDAVFKGLIPSKG